MRKIILLALLLCSLAASCLANVPLMPVRDLRPGMQGVGRTVIQGDTIEEFNVEILGVNGSESAGYSILVRVYGDLIEKTGGVAQGMSGSPVYVDGRLVGAVAFGRVFNDPHYCFLTPIGSMLRLLDSPQLQDEGGWIPKDKLLPAAGGDAEAKDAGKKAAVKAMAAPLLAGGFEGYGLEYLQERMGALGLEVLGGGGAGQLHEGTGALQPGSALAVSVMQGDLTLGALGTVTWTDGEGNILAFGHPFMQNGDSNFFLNKAWILGCIPNLSSSYKIGNIGASIGRITQDRSSGIAGVLGRDPASVPVFITVSDGSRGLNSSCRVRIIEDEKLLPAAVDAAVVNMAAKTVDRSGGGTARFYFKITGADSKKELLTLERENMYYAGSDLLKGMDQELTEAMNVLMQNKLDKVSLYGVTVKAEIAREARVAEITRVKARQQKAKPGEKVTLDVALKPFRGPEFMETIEFALPENFAQDKLALSVRGGSSLAWLQQLLRKQQEEGLPSAQKQEKAKTLQDFVKSVSSADKNNELIVDISNLQQAPQQRTQGADAAADTGVAGMLQGSPYKTKRALGFIVDGEAELVLAVER